MRFPCMPGWLPRVVAVAQSALDMSLCIDAVPQHDPGLFDAVLLRALLCRCVFRVPGE